MRPILYATLASAAFLGAGECALADSFVDRSPLFADVDPSSPGVETIIPFQRTSDLDGDGNPDQYQVLLNVYAGGTKTLLYKTAPRSTPIVFGCVAPFTGFAGANIKPIREADSSRVHLAVALMANCNQTTPFGIYTEVKSFVYSADAASASGAVWSYVVPGQYLTSFDAVDVDADGDHEVVLATRIYVDPDNTSAGSNTVITALNKDTGAVISRNSYPEVR